jgi:predicted nucleotidyltransferase
LTAFDTPEVRRALDEVIAAHRYPLLFATISGAHLYGFPSSDSDFDLRGVHVLPLDQVVGLRKREETITEMSGGVPEVDLVTHDAEKFLRLMLRPNGYVLEQLYSPLVVRTTAEHGELAAIGRGCITSRHVHHYRGFAAAQWRLFEKEFPRRVKPLLYVFRVLLTAIHMMRSGDVEANLVRLNDEWRLPYIDDLIARKVGGSEHETIDEHDVQFFQGEYEKLLAQLEAAATVSALPEEPSAGEALHRLLLRIRLGTR